MQGLEDQLLATVVNKERPDLEELKTQLIIQNTEFTIKLKQLEDDLLHKLSTAEGDITEDVALIESLEESKRVATEINEKVKEAKTTEIAINENRNKYRNVAARGAMLFFLLNSLNKIHAFYQFSLNAFVSVFGRGLDLAPGGRKKKKPAPAPSSTAAPSAEPSQAAPAAENSAVSAGSPGLGESGIPAEQSQVDVARTDSRRASESQGSVGGDEEDDDEGLQLTPEALEKRLQSLLDTCTYTVYNYTRRGLFDRDKLIVLTLLTFTILIRSQVRSRRQQPGSRSFPLMFLISAK